MVTGIESFKEWFKGNESQYVLKLMKKFLKIKA